MSETKYVINGSTLTNIANAIRAKSGGSVRITPGQMPNEIANLPSGGVFDWVVDGSASLPYDPNLGGIVVSDNNVTEIRNTAFYNFDANGPKIVKIDFPSVTEIGSSAFNGNTLLKTAILPSIYSIGGSAFADCSILDTVTGIDNAGVIKKGAFKNCSLLEIDTLGSAQYGIKLYTEAFYNCPKIVNLVFNGDVDDDDSGIRSVFDYCTGLKTIYAKRGFKMHFISPNTNTMFKNCPIEDVKIMGAAYIGGYIFKGLTTIKRVCLGSTPTLLTSTAFSGCTGVTDCYVSWSEGDVQYAPWGMTNATIHYDTQFDSDGEPITA